MRSRSQLRRWIATALLFSTGSCGLLGDKDDLLKNITFGDDQKECWNGLDVKIRLFSTGEIAESEWQKIFQCTDGALETFTRFVKGSRPDGYSSDDIRQFANKILKTDHPLSAELVQALFELKVVLFGGDVRTLTYKEVYLFRKLIAVVSAESTPFIPLLRILDRSPNYVELIRFTDQITQALRNLGAQFGGPSATGFSKQAFAVILEELRKSFNFQLDPLAADPAFAAKAVLTGGSPDLIQGEEVRQILDSVGPLAGALLGFSKTQSGVIRDTSAFGHYLDQSASRVKVVFDQLLKWNGGRLELSKLDLVVDRMQASWLPVAPKALKTTLRPLIHKLLLSQSSEQVDQSTVDAGFSLLKSWARGQFHIDQIFEHYHLEKSAISTEEFVVAALDYSSRLSPGEQKEVQRIMNIAEQYRPVFYGDDGQVNYSDWSRNSYRNLSIFQAIRLGVGQLIRNYAVNPRQQRVSLEEFKVFFNDFLELGVAAKVIDPSEVGQVDKRFREADLFTFSSDGDSLMSADEATYLVANMISISTMKERVRIITQERCRIGDEKDFFGWYWMDATCFNDEYFGRYTQFWDHFSGLVNYYSRLSPEEKTGVQRSMEITARSPRLHGEPVGNFDTQNYVGVIHYMEAVLARFDENQSGKLELPEALAAYPKFAQMIKTLGGVKDDPTAEAAFTYILKFKRMPKKDFFGIIHFFGWMITKPFWSLEVDRGGLYEISAFFNPPAAATSARSPASSP